MDVQTDNAHLRLELERAKLDLARVRAARPVVIALRKAEAAQAIGLSERTLHRLLKRGEIRGRKVGGLVLVPVEELERWLESRPLAGGPAEGPQVHG